jgi:transposase InsO family protein
MAQYTTLSDYEKQRKLKEVEEECRRLNKPTYWILKQLGIPKSTYYGWLSTGSTSKSKAPHTIWNKTPKDIEKKIIALRDNTTLRRSERMPAGIATKLEEFGIFMTAAGVWKVLVRYKKNRMFSECKKVFCIFQRASKFFDVVCIDDVALTNRKPREWAVFNAIDEYSQVSVGILFVTHRINRNDVIELLEQIYANYGRFPKIVRLDNAKAHASNVVKQYCFEHCIKLQFIDAGTPQQNWPVESFNGVIKKDLIKTQLWNWNDGVDRQRILEEYRIYYNMEKRLGSDPLKRTPNEIATAITSSRTQQRLKYKLLRKHYGQVVARQAILKRIVLLPEFVRNVR